ncbi:translation initiation factor eIF-3 subunit [Wickerhamomyces ciferrii]|uniref:Eukaryotic translation initiation factor 3 subunit B n=1 Tax=Wickerhamomyces ciferrii (strain ATCC 14091 / BCRC 22168 / CBS 111 / JCM 3599 / NBRC 0793 / NRRL Y-1031 F-60-10) TaxID=1206466 RepID=K0KTG9_WICCF|nr:translation initiation factor eIF-3 subunit [Wickerhamomyces ciferrii]CCH45307.1 translation initiation factor eIF-3 subunit [Wickerhamomyces ciferrii]
MGLEQPKLEDIPVDDIDFSDLEAQYAVEDDTSFDKYLVVDGAPIAPEAKVPILTKVLTKLLSQHGTVTNFYMPIEDGKTRGFAFVEYETPEIVEKTIKSLNGKKLDVKHRLFLNKLTDIEKYGAEGNVTDDFQEPQLPPFEETDYLRSWLQDESGRDQFILQKQEMVGVFWNKKKENPEPAIEPRLNWTTSFIKFSPKGSYVFSIHPQGLQAWGGRDFKSLKRFSHPGVRLIDFSPDEKYLISLSPEPIILPPEDHPKRASFPFGPESEGHKLIIWDIATGLPARTFALPPHLEQRKEMIWPLLKWSHDGKYVARLGPNALAIYDATEDFALLDKKPLKIDNIMDFEFAPHGVQLATAKKQDPLTHVLAYWTPETGNQTARVALLEVPSKKVLRTINLFQVSDVKLHWQDNAEYLAVKVDRHTKSKKTLFTNLEFFKLNEKEIPVEKIELKDRVVNFGWEPKGDRFVTISRPEVQGANPAIARNAITFYAPELPSKGKIANLKKWIAFKVIEPKFSNTINWAPKGRFLVISTVGTSSQGGLEFYDMDYPGEKKESESTQVNAHVREIGKLEYAGLTDLEWDPSGRFVAAWSSFWRHKIENGYRLLDLAGHVLREELIDDFKAFIWRPRPESLLTGGDRKKVRKNLREYSAQFDESDAMEASEATRELILNRRRLLEEWTSWRSTIDSHKDDYGIVQESTSNEDEEVIEEIKEEILEEKEEIVA